MTGPGHSGVELHGLVSHLVKVAVSGDVYTIYGYKGKQVRDQLHSFDVVRAMEEFIENPRCASVYNLGGGRPNSASVLESIERVEQITGRPLRHKYQDRHRPGDHICYISNVGRFKRDYPNWNVTRSLDAIFTDVAKAEIARVN